VAPEHWHLAFQGQLRTVSNADAALIESRLHEAAVTVRPAEATA
jgi:hypothetical protein